MIALLLASGFEEVEAVTPADFLRRAGLEVKVVGIGGKMIAGSHGIAWQADTAIEDLQEEPDAVVVPGGMPGAENVAASDAALDLIRRVFDAGGTVAAICAAPAVVLQKTGILQGKRVTCYPGFEDRFSGCTPLQDRVVVDGNVVTSRGPGTAAEFSIKLIELLAGKESASEVHRRTLQP
jgi:4-methyl-5(b-hydroxyethyl)-thiazole monophosphate biosynthesis